jgi:hypothetical protein
MLKIWIASLERPGRSLIIVKLFGTTVGTVRCTENTIYVFPKMKQGSLISNFYIHVSVSDLYFPRIGLPIWLQQNRQTDPVNIYIAHRYMNVEIGRQT